MNSSTTLTYTAIESSVQQADRKAAIVSATKFYPYSDPWHYHSAGYIDLGEKFAKLCSN